MHKAFGAGLLAATLALGGCNSDDNDDGKEDDLRAEVPNIEAATGGAGEAALAADLQFGMDSVGYSEKEFILSGTAVSYLPKGGQSLGTDGQWAVEENDSAAYVTRAVVYQPLDAEAFNGTVIIEWMNVTSGSDSSLDLYTQRIDSRRLCTDQPVRSGSRGGQHQNDGSRAICQSAAPRG